jgi:hypothetical protein
MCLCRLNIRSAGRHTIPVIACNAMQCCAASCGHSNWPHPSWPTHLLYSLQHLVLCRVLSMLLQGAKQDHTISNPHKGPASCILYEPLLFHALQ